MKGAGLLAFTWLVGLVSGEGQLSFVYNTFLGTYQIQVQNTTWLVGAQTYFTVDNKTYSSADGSLKLTSTYKSSGTDKLGSWRTVTFMYTAGKAKIETSIRLYPRFDALVFGQHFVNGASGMSLDDRSCISTAFPNFKIPPGGGGSPLGYLAYGGMMVGDVDKSIGRFDQTNLRSSNGIEGGPMALFDAAGNATIISSFSNFMVGFPCRGVAEYGWGLQGALKSVPAGFKYETAIFYGRGIRGAFDNWGYHMRKYYGKSTKPRDTDFTNNYLSYWSDNGAYFVQYYTKNWTLQNMSYEKALVTYKQYSDSLGIPFRSMQYSVWYITQANSSLSSPTVTYEPFDKILPHGLDYMREQIRLPITSHNRAWSPKNTYAKQNGGKYNFIIESFSSLPQDQQFWLDLFDQMKRWEFSTYMQDWLNIPPERMDATVENATVLRDWLIQMGRGASAYDITIQYCMALPMYIMQSLEIPSVTQARASTDYQPHTSSTQWQIGMSSLFAEAMGIAPFKDTFWTTSDQPGNFYNGREEHPALQAVVSSLSAGPVGPGDMVNGTNATLLMRCCNTDGLLLKPDRPARPINDQLIQKAGLGSAAAPLGPDGEVWTTYSVVGRYAFGVIFAAGVQNSYKLTPMEAFHTQNSSMVYGYEDAHPVTPRLFSADHPVTIDTACSLSDFCLYYTTPPITFGWKYKTRKLLFLGEMNKWIPVSSRRFLDVNVNDENVLVRVTGGPSEKVLLHYVIDSLYVTVDCVLSNAGDATLDVWEHKCS